MKIKILIVVITLCTQLGFSQWTKIGNDIDGEFAFDYSANTNELAISGDGTIVAIAASNNDINGSNSGHIKVYKNVNNIWTQMGTNINGTARNDNFGQGIDLSKDGKTIAIGDPGNENIKVFTFENNDWLQKGNNTNTISSVTGIGSDVAINADGTRIATSIANTIIIYDFINNNWFIQDLIDLPGDRNSLTNASLELNDLGTILIVGNRQYTGDNNGTEDGRVLVYQNVDDAWSQKGSSIIGVQEGGNFGTSVDISRDGQIITFGSPYSEVNGISEAGFVKTFKFENNDWLQIGTDIGGLVSEIHLGTSVSLNFDGTILAVGSSGTGSFGSSRGIAQVFKFENNDWLQISSTIVGDAAADRFGASIALSDLGSVVAIGASFNDGNGSNSGHARIFKNEMDFPRVTLIPDVNFEQYLIDNSLDSENILDGKVLTADIENVQSLNISNKNITDVTGIESFISLTSLNASNNNITSINLTNNINLESLNFANNTIETLDFTSNTKLEELYISNNIIESLDVSMLLDLKLLWCFKNELSTLNTSNNSKLESLDCGTNQLTILSVDENIALTELICNFNQLTALEVSLNTNLISLNCEQNSITYLDMSSNENLTKIICNDNALVGLNMQNGNNNQVLNENFSAFANPNLFCVLVDVNFTRNWSQIDMQTEFSKSCPELVIIPDANFEAYLESINVGNGIVGDNLVNKELIEALTSLSIASKNINDTSGIEYFTNLTFLDITDNGLTQIELSKNILLETFLADANQFITFNFAQNTKLKTIEARNNLLITLDLNALVDLERLELEYNQITTLDLFSNTKISILDLKNNQLETLDLSNQTELVTFEANNNLLRFINLKNTANPTISTFITTNNPNLTCIEVFNLDYFNNISISIDAHTKFYENCPSTTAIPDANFEAYLESINLGNGVVNDGLVLTEVIEVVTILNIAEKNIANLIGIQDFTNLKELNANNNTISEVDFSQNVNLEELLITNNQLLLIDLSNNLSLKTLDVGENQLTEIAVYFLTELESLSVYKNQLSIINLISNKKLLAFIANENQLKAVDIRENTNLFWIDVDDNLLENLTIKNGNNSSITQFSATGNPNLSCIEVDDVIYSETNWTEKDSTATFSGDCAPANDDCSFAMPLVIWQTTPGDINSGTFTNATDCVAGPIIADVWFTVTVPETGEFSIEGSGFGGLLKFALYDSCTSTSSISCGLNISLTNVNPGNTYYLKVWMEASVAGKSASENGTFILTTSESSVLSTDSFLRENSKLIVYPNPSSSILYLKSTNQQPIDFVEIYTLIGKKVFHQKKIENSIIDISKLSKGIYILKAKMDKTILSKKIIIN